jgi:flagellar motor switch protein FliN
MSPTPTTTVQTELAAEAASRADRLVEAAAAALTVALGTPVDPGPADLQADPAELVPAEPGLATAAEVAGDIAAASVLLTTDVADAVTAADPGGRPWTAVLDDVLEAWGSGLGAAVGRLTPPSPAPAVGALLPDGPGYLLVAGGLFAGDRHVGTVAIVVRPPQADPGPIPAAAPVTAAAVTTNVAGPLQALAEVQMSVTAELGRCRMSVHDLLALVPGSIVELDRSAGSPIDLLVNGTLIARGEVVVVDEEFGVRLTEIVGPED